MRYSSKAVKAVLAIKFGIASAACCDDDVRGVTTSFSRAVWVGYSYAWVGDTATLYAEALADLTTSFFCSGVLYSSAAEPSRFQFASTDPPIATVNQDRLFTGRATGLTGIVTTTAGVSDTLPVIVGPAFTSLRITATPAVARVGDTITLQLDALDGAGAVVTGAEVQLLQLLHPSDSLAIWLRSDRAPRLFPSTTFQSPMIDRLVLLRPGVLRLEAVAPRDTGRPLRYVADTLTLTITAS